jgi:hypothetical protein
VLASERDSSDEGKERILVALRSLFAEIQRPTVREELTRLISNRLDLNAAQIDRVLATPAVASGRAERRNGSAKAPERGVDLGLLSARRSTERAFLALCIAESERGRSALESVDITEHFSSELVRRAVQRLREAKPGESLAAAAGRLSDLDDDPELKALLAELIVEAGREQSPRAMLEVQRLQLELVRVEKQIQRATVEGSGDVSELAERRATLKREFDVAYGRALEQTGGRAD